MELARWYYAGAIGAIPQYLETKAMFLVASNAIRYRFPIPPFHSYQIETQIVYWDNEWIYFLHRFIDPTDKKLYAESVCRATIKAGKRRVSMQEFYTQATGETVVPPLEMPAIVKELLEWDAACKQSMDKAQLETLEKK